MEIILLHFKVDFCQVVSQAPYPPPTLESRSELREPALLQNTEAAATQRQPRRWTQGLPPGSLLATSLV